MFFGRNLLIATMHHKEKIMAPILEKELGVKCFVLENYNTDMFGTFTGEIDRKDDVISTARNKCLTAMKLANCDLAVASEGSFGSHPTIHFIPANDELVLLLDNKNNFEISARSLSTETNYGGTEINNLHELKKFAKQSHFPTHSLILKNQKDNFKEVVKGINNLENLATNFEYFYSKYKKVYVETDMRAMHNPTRLNVIEAATNKLIENIKLCCPQCNTPGFVVTQLNYGLPCENCQLPTDSVLSQTHTCRKCKYAKIEQFPFGKFTESPMYCKFCNP
jgi:hypothetical protein